MNSPKTSTPRRTLRDAARRSVRRALRAAQRGMTLTEIMIVVVIMGLIASAVGIAVFDRLKEARVKTCEQDVRQIENAAELWQTEHRGCPTMAQLREDRALDRRARERDPWDNDYILTCEGGEVRVHSKGPDGQDGSDDDVPRRRATNR